MNRVLLRGVIGLFVYTLWAAQTSQAQMSIGTATPTAGTILDLTNGFGGTLLLPTRANDPTGGLTRGLFYTNNTTNTLRFYNGSTWQEITALGNAVNTANGLVRLQSNGSLPALSGASLTNMSAYAITNGVLNVAFGGTGQSAVFPENAILFTNFGGVYTSDNLYFSYNPINKRMGLLTNNPSNTFAIGANSEFQVSPTGDLARINNVPYVWPTTNAAGVLTNDASGNLSWAPAGGGGLTLPYSVTDNTNAIPFSITASTGQIGSAVITGTFSGGGTSGNNGVKGETNSDGSNAAGVFGTTLNARGVWGRATGLNAGATGVYGAATAGTANTTYGVFGLTNSSSPTSAAVYGQAINGYGGYFESTTGAALVTGTGNVGIGTPTPASLLSVGSTNQFQVTASGNIASINGVPYKWPVNNAAGVLTNDASGNLSWAPAGGGGGFTLPINRVDNTNANPISITATFGIPGSGAIVGQYAGGGNADNYGLIGESNSDGATSAGVYGKTFNGNGVYGEARGFAANAVGVYGASTNSTPNITYGVYGTTFSTHPNSAAVYGYAPGVGIGVYGKSAQGNGGFFESASGAALVTGTGNVGIGATIPPSLLTVGNGNQFQVTASGDVARINNVPYKWPTSNASGVLTSDAAGNLSWAPASGGGFTLPYDVTDNSFANPFVVRTNIGAAGSAAISGYYQGGASVNSGGIFGSTNANSNTAFGVMGFTSTRGYGVFGQTDGSSSTSAGVYGSATSATTTANYGVYGISYSTSISGAGVYGYSPSTRGVFGQSVNGVGGYFTSNTSYSLITGTGNVGIGTSAPASLLSVGSTNQFQVTASGDVARINNVPYKWPTSNASGVLTSDAAGNLSWAAAGGFTLPQFVTDNSSPAPFTIRANVGGNNTAAITGIFNAGGPLNSGAILGTTNASGTTAFGVKGTTSAGGYGVYGSSSATVAGTTGVYGEAIDPSAVATYGVVGTTQSTSTIGAGVYGISSSSIGVYGKSSLGNGGFFESGSGPALVTGTGNVGIGTNNPTAKLDVNGSVKFAAVIVSSTPFTVGQNDYLIVSTLAGLQTDIKLPDPDATQKGRIILVRSTLNVGGSARVIAISSGIVIWTKNASSPSNAKILNATQSQAMFICDGTAWYEF